MRKGMVRFLVLLVAFLIITSSCIGSSAGKKVLTFGLSTEPSHLRIGINNGQAARAVVLNIYRGLFSYNSATGKVVNELAESYTVAPDNKTYTFKLRNAKFHNGDPVTAQDVKFTFARLMDSKTGATYRSEISNIEHMTVIDSRTIKIALKTPCAPFIHYLAIPESSILSEKWVEQHPDLTANPMGAGPYKFVKWNKGQNIVLTKFNGYYKKGLPKINTLKFNFYAQDDVRTNAIISRDADIIEFTPWKDIPALAKDNGLKTVTEFGACMEVVMNPAFKPLSDPRVRQAIAYAIDRNKIINTAFSGRGKCEYGAPVQKGFAGYNAKLAKYFSYNIKKAKNLLSEAGYQNGFNMRLLSTSTYAMHQQTAISVQDDLKKIGINITLDLPDWATRLKKGLEYDYDAAIVGITWDYADPDCLETYFYGSAVSANHPVAFNDSELNKLFDIGKSTLDKAKRQEIYDKLYKRLLDLSPAAFCNWRDQSYTMKTNLKGFKNLPGPLTIYSPVSLENAELK